MDDAEETLRVLKGAKELIEKGWAQGCMARDSNGCYAQYDSKEAVCFCITGALWRVGQDEKVVIPLIRLMQHAAGVPEDRFISSWNDVAERTQEEVVALFDKATAALEAMRC